MAFCWLIWRLLKPPERLTINYSMFITLTEESYLYYSYLISWMTYLLPIWEVKSELHGFFRNSLELEYLHVSWSTRAAVFIFSNKKKKKKLLWKFSHCSYKLKTFFYILQKENWENTLDSNYNITNILEDFVKYWPPLPYFFQGFSFLPDRQGWLTLYCFT